MGPLDVECRFLCPAAVLTRLRPAGKDDFEAAVSSGACRQAKLTGEDTQVILRSRIVKGIHNGNDAGTAETHAASQVIDGTNAQRCFARRAASHETRSGIRWDQDQVIGMNASSDVGRM